MQTSNILDSLVYSTNGCGKNEVENAWFNFMHHWFQSD